MLFVFNVPYEEVRADGGQPVDTGPVVLSCTRLLHKISHKRPEEKQNTHSRFYNIFQIKLTGRNRCVVSFHTSGGKGEAGIPPGQVFDFLHMEFL